MPTSAIPAVYYAIFAIYEPMLCIVGFFGTFLNPEAVRAYSARTVNEPTSSVL